MDSISAKIQKRITGYILSRFGLTGTVSTTAGQRTRQRHCRLSNKTGLATIQKAGHKETPQPEPEPVETSTREKSEAPKKLFLRSLNPYKVEVFQPEP